MQTHGSFISRTSQVQSGQRLVLCKLQQAVTAKLLDKETRSYFSRGRGVTIADLFDIVLNLPNP